MSGSPNSRKVVLLKKSPATAVAAAFVREQNRQIKPLVELLESDQHSAGATNLLVILSSLQTMIVDMSEVEKNKMIALFATRLTSLPDSDEKKALALAFNEMSKNVLKIRQIYADVDLEEVKKDTKIIEAKGQRDKRTADALTVAASLSISGAVTYSIRDNIPNIGGAIAKVVGNPFGQCFDTRTIVEETTNFWGYKSVSTRQVTERIPGYVCDAFGYLSGGIESVNTGIGKTTDIGFIIFFITFALLLFLLYKLLTRKVKLGLWGSSVELAFKKKSILKKKSSLKKSSLKKKSLKKKV
jgi:hypothetical protein